MNRAEGRKFRVLNDLVLGTGCRRSGRAQAMMPALDALLTMMTKAVSVNDATPKAI